MHQINTVISFNAFITSPVIKCCVHMDLQIRQQTFPFPFDMYIVSYLADSFGGSTVRDCQLCPAGQYCHQRGRAEPSGQCAEGYYCPEGQSSERPQQHVCSVGHYCEKVIRLVLVLKLLSVSAAEYCM